MSKCTCPNKECEIHGTPPDPQHGRKLAELGAQYGREPNKVKPLAQYLGEYIEHEVELGNVDVGVAELYAWDSWQQLLQQALDAYQSTENVTIKIEKNT